MGGHAPSPRPSGKAGPASPLCARSHACSLNGELRSPRRGTCPSGPGNLTARRIAPQSDDLVARAELDQRIGGVDARPQLHAGVDLAARAEDGSGVEHRVAADRGFIADDRAELPPAGRELPAVDRDRDLAAVVAEVRADDAGAEVHAAAEDRVADVVQVRGVRAVEED